MKEKRTLLFMLLALATMTVWAQNAIAIYQKDGKVARFAFSEKPVVTYSGADLVMTTTKTSVHYPLNMLKKLIFEDELTAAVNVEALEMKSSVQFSALPRISAEDIHITNIIVDDKIKLKK